ncbi:lycopene cyclase family protein [Streptomyces sp. NPDC048387]|uniref:lycopene cyclase family protein n=1 Tax=Streptomyces sp. NPDC048387 TaxID=3365542 RepID=UPI0037173017
MTRSSDIVVVGAGAAGLSLAWRLLDPPPGVRAPEVVLVDAPAGPLRPAERTWCFWEAGAGDYEPLLSASWRRLRVRAPDGGGRAHDLGELRYKMLRSRAFERGLRERLTGLRRIEAVVERITDGPDGAEVVCRGADGDALTLRARWVYDSRPPTPPPSRVSLVQHFRGWFVRCERPAFDPGTVELMDFRTPQPAYGLSFGYVLPLSPHEALVEYTEFGRAPLPRASYNWALRHYAARVLGLGPYRVTGTEQGAIAMTDGRYARRAGRHVFRIGAAGGAVRPSTGYAFAAIQRQCRAVADAVHTGRRPPVPPPAHPARGLAMDAVLLRGLHTGRVDGPAFFSRLFDEVPAGRLLRFLDGTSRPGEEFAIGLRTPVAAMLRTAAELPLLPRRAPLTGSPSPRP